jgi:hypothetical protein
MRDGGTAHNDNLVLKEGNVGIGTNDPAGLLHVVGPALDATVQLPTGSISSVEIANEAGGAGSFEDDFWVSIVQGEPAIVLDSCVMEAPATGIVVAFATASIWDAYHDSDPTSYHFGISKNSSIDRYVELSGYSNWSATIPITVVDYFVVSAGETTFYFIAESQGDDFVGGTAYNPLIYTIFLPTTYSGNKSTELTPESEIGNDLQLLQYSGTTIAEPTRSDAEQINALGAEFDAKLKAMEEDFQRKLEELQNEK